MTAQTHPHTLSETHMHTDTHRADRSSNQLWYVQDEWLSREQVEIEKQAREQGGWSYHMFLKEVCGCVCVCVCVSSPESYQYSASQPCIDWENTESAPNNHRVQTLAKTFPHTTQPAPSDHTDEGEDVYISYISAINAYFIL